MRLRIAPEAEQELAEAAAWYEERRAGLGFELMARIDKELRRIAEQPLADPMWRTDRDYRRHVVTRFPYVIFFRIEAEEIVVVAIAHARRKPSYWQDRR
jgi:plasmid stabilization system protein ParE